MKRRWFWRLSALTLLVAVVLGGGLVMTLQPTELETLHFMLEDYRFATTGVRLSVIALIGLVWPKLVHASELRGHLSLERSVELQALRWRIVTWLILIELLIGQNLLSLVWQTSTGSTA